MMDLQQIELIKRLKYRYMRTLDLNNWTELADCFTEDAETNYDNGKYSFKGKANIIAFLKKFMDRPTQITQHHVHHPEIDLISDTTAKGIWYLQDIVIDLDADTTLRGAGFYHDEYEKVGGEWKIKMTGYSRTYEEIEQRSDKIKLTTNTFSR
jgi:hypothetical protein